MRKHLLVSFFIFFTANIFAQAPSWQWASDANSNSPETAWDVAYDSFSTNVYVGGSFQGNLSARYGVSFTSSYGNADGFLAKYDQSGSVLWAIKIGGNNDDEVHGVAADGLGNVYVTGYFTGTADFDPSASTFNLVSSGGQDGFLAKYSSAGALVWAVKFGGNADEDSWKMSANTSGVYITGSYESLPATFYSYSNVTTKTTSVTDNQSNTYGAKYNSSGVVQWVISGGGNQNDMGFNVTADASNVYFIGRYDATITFKNASGVAFTPLQDQNNNKPQVYILCVTQAGLISWQTNITSSQGGKMVIGWGITQDASNLYVTGYMDGNINFKYPTPTLTQALSPGGGTDIYLAKLTKAGVFTWNASVTGSGSGDQVGRALEMDASGNIILGGTFETGLNYSIAGGPNFPASGQDVFVTSYSNSGTFLWSVKAGGPGNENFNGLSVDNVGGIYLSGDHGGSAVFGSTTLGNGGGTNIFVAKLGCAMVTSNTISSSQTICAGSSPSTFTGSLPAGGITYAWQMSLNSLTWTAAPGTYTNQNYAPSSLTTTTYYRRVLSGSGSCSLSTFNSNTITIYTDSPPSVSFAGNNQTVCVSTAALAALSPTIGNGTWSLLSGTGTITSSTSFSSQVTGLGTGTNQFVWTVSNGTCIAATSTVTIIRDAQPVSNAGVSQTLCASTATLAAVSPTIGTGLWSVVNGAGAVTSISNASSQVTSLSTGPNQFVWTVSNGTCTAATSTVTIIRDAQPVSNAGVSQTLCASIATLAAVSPTTGSGLWSVITGTGTVTSISNASSQVTSLSTGINQFVWTVSNGTCVAATSTVTIIRDAQPVSNAGVSQTLCASIATLAAVSPTTGSGLWSVITGTGTVTSISNASSQVTSLSTGINQFVWTVSNGTCVAATSTVTIIRDAQPVSNAGISQTLCASTATLAAVSPTIGSGLWSVITGTGTVTSISNASSQVTSLSTGINQFVWTVSNGTCVAATSTVTIIRDAQPVSNAGISQTLCASTATLAAVSPTIGSGLWSVITGTGTVTSISNASSQVTSLSTGTNQFVWTVFNGTCVAATSTVTIIRDAQPTSNAGVSQTLCASTATLAAVSPTIGTGLWSVVIGTGGVTSISNASSQVTSLSTGTNQFVWTVSNGTCIAATSTVTIIRDAQPTSNAGVSQTLCASTATLAAVSPTIGSGLWFVVSGTGALTSISNASSQVTSLSTGTNQFVWTVSNGTCIAATSTVTIIRDAQPVSNAGVSQTLCASTATLAAVSPTIGSGLWSVVTGTGGVTSISNASSQVTSLSTGTNQFVWTVSNGTCIAATSTVTIIRDAQPTSFAGVSQTLCASTATLAAVSPTIGSGLWSVVTGTGGVTSISNASSQVTSLSTGTNQFVWTVSNGTCIAATSTVNIIRDAQPTSFAGVSQTICSATATMNATPPTIGTGIWTLVSGAGNITSAMSATSQITSLGTGTNNFAWTVSNGVCTAVTSSITLIRDAQPISNAGNSQTVCSSNAILAAGSPTIGSGAWSVSSGTGIVTTTNNPGSPVTSLSNGINIFVWTVSNGVCSPVTSTVSITRDIAPSSNAGSNQTICAATATMAAVSPTPGTGSWSLLSGSGSILSSSSSSTQIIGILTGTSSFVWTVSNGTCNAATSTVIITRSPGITANAGSSLTVCSSTATLGATTPTAGSGLWSVITGTSSVNTNTNPGSVISSLNVGLNTFLWTVSSSACPAATSLVDVWRDAQPTANAGTDQNICSSNTTLSAISPTIGTGIWSIVSGTATSLALNTPLAILNSLGTGTNVFMWTVTNGVCLPATSTVTVVRNLPPVAIAGTDQAVCAQNATLGATAPVTGNGVWSVLSGTGTISSFTNPVSPITALGTGTNVFLWTVSNGGCPSSTSAVTIIQDIQPTSLAGADQTICATSVTLAAAIPSVGTGIWSLTNGTASITAPGNAGSTVTGVGTGTNSFVWIVSNGACTPASSTVNVINDMSPGIANAGNDFTVCSSSCTLSALTSTPGNTGWSVYNGSSSVISVNNATSAVSNLGNGLNQFIWSVTNGSCPPSYDTVSVYVMTPLPTASAGPDQQICSTECILAANNAGYGAWTIFTGSAVINNPSGATTSVTSLNAGNTVFIWSVSQAFCPGTTDTVIIHRDESPGVADAGADQHICGPVANLSAVDPLTGQGEWKTTEGPGSLSDLHLSQTTVTALYAGINKFVWTIRNGVCPSSSDTTVIQSDAVPSAALAGKDLLVCQDEITLDANIPQAGNGNWSLISGTCSIIQPGTNNTSISGLKEGIHLLKWTITNGVCAEKSDTVQITRTFTPISPDAGNDQILETSTAQLGATIPQAGVGTWSVLSGNCEISDIHDKYAFISALPFGNTILRWTIANKSCPDVSDDIIINVKNLNIPNAFSPNGDGINDSFVITSLDYYKDVKISIFSRWGTLLYHNTEYHNDWAGNNLNNEHLADDTYYYIIEIPELKNFTGFVIIKRDR